MTNEKLNGVVRRLFADRRFLARFRRDPAAATGGYGLTDDELDAVKSGDQTRLITLGLDVRIMDTRPIGQGIWTHLLPVACKMAAPTALALVIAAALLPGATALAVGRECKLGARCDGPRTAARRIGLHRALGPRGLRRAMRRTAAKRRVARVRFGIRARASYAAGMMRALSRLAPDGPSDRIAP